MTLVERVGQWFISAGHDVRHGRRTLLRTPLATGVMIASIALGIGVATAVFTLADVMLMRPLPFPGAERLVVPFQTLRVQSRAREDTVAWTFARYEVLKRAARGFDALGFAAWTDAVVRVADEDRPIRVEAITRSLIPTFSIAAQSGRAFITEEDDATNPTTVAMISDRLWRSAFGANPRIVGSTLEVDGTPVTVIGIMPPRFTGFTIGADVWLPVRMMGRIDPAPRWTERLAAQSGTVVGRTAPGITLTALNRSLIAALPLINDVATDRFTGNTVDRGIGVVTLAEARRHPLVKPILELMTAAVVGLLAIVCANIASILLARGHARRGEMGVRIALGASPRRIGRQVLTECALLAAVALPCGILIGSFCAEALANVRPALPQNWVLLRGTDLLAGATFDPNVHVLVFASLVAALATMLFGIGPAISASRVHAARLIATSGDLHATAPVRGKQILVVSQVALATILLISAGLMLRSLNALLRVDLGFRPEGVVTLALASSDTSASARLRRQDLITHLATAPGIGSVATSGCVPFDLACVVTLGVRALSSSADRPIDAEVHGVSSGYFRTLGIPLVSGRVFANEDTTIDRTPVVISEAAARQLFGGASPIGKQLALDQPNARSMNVIGVVRDVRFRSVDAVGAPAIYTLTGEDATAPRFTTTLFVRSTISAAAASVTVTREIRAAEAPMSVTGMRTMPDVVRAETSTIRFVTLLLLGFAVAALALAGLGVYGVVAYTVSQRTKELGLRLVLGADDRGLLISTLARGSLLVAIGLSAGVVLALATSRLVSSFLFGVQPLDAFTYVAVIGVVGAIGVVATLVPARRVMRIDASAALRT